MCKQNLAQKKTALFLGQSSFVCAHGGGRERANSLIGVLASSYLSDIDTISDFFGLIDLRALGADLLGMVERLLVL
jgi:hypothetical protein